MDDIINIYKLSNTILEGIKHDVAEIKILNSEVKKLYPNNSCDFIDHLTFLQLRVEHNKLMREIKELL